MLGRNKPKKTCINKTFHTWFVINEKKEQCKKCGIVIANREWMSKKAKTIHEYRKTVGALLTKNGMSHRWTHHKMLNLIRILPTSFRLYVETNGQLEAIIANSLYHLRYECNMSYRRIKLAYLLEDSDIDYFIMKHTYVHHK